MRTLVLVVALVAASLPSSAQENDAPEGAPIKAAEVSGSALNQLSPELKRDINALVGEKLSRERVNAIAARIEAENPDVVAAVRTIAQSDGEVRVIFFIARISEDVDLASNINARYTVESVEISGVPDSKVSRPLRDRLQSLVGGRLDPDEAERLNEQLSAELPGYNVTRQISRGSQPGRIRVVFEVSEAEGPTWIRFQPPRSKFVFHSDQKWSGVLDIPMGGRDHRFTAGFVFANKDDLIEEYSGYRLRFESRKLATERLGARIEFSDFNEEWRPETLAAIAANPRIPEPYRERQTIEPTVTFAFNPYVSVTAGASITELESLSRSPASQQANAGLFSIGYDRRWRQPFEFSQMLQASYELRSAATALDSDLSYTRHLGRVRYAYQRGDSTVLASLALGRITGDAPLFERFSLGDTSTLRGWNKYDIAPAGSDRMYHQSLEYRYHGFAMFFDNGSVWDSGTDVHVRLSTGFGFHIDNFFVTLGFPLNADDVTTVFMTGVRF